MITNDAACTCEIISKTASSKAALNKEKTLFVSKLGLELRKKLVNCYIRSIALYCAGTWTLPKIEQNYLKSFDIWCWRGLQISRNDRVKKKKTHVLSTIVQMLDVITSFNFNCYSPMMD
jgi:hypothetical protein